MGLKTEDRHPKSSSALSQGISIIIIIVVLSFDVY